MMTNSEEVFPKRSVVTVNRNASELVESKKARLRRTQSLFLWSSRRVFRGVGRGDENFPQNIPTFRNEHKVLHGALLTFRKIRTVAIYIFGLPLRPAYCTVVQYTVWCNTHWVCGKLTTTRRGRHEQRSRTAVIP